MSSLSSESSRSVKKVDAVGGKEYWDSVNAQLADMSSSEEESVPTLMTKLLTPSTASEPAVVAYSPSSSSGSSSSSSSSQPLISLHYFDFPGKCESLRLLAYYNRLNFADVRYTRSQFLAKKASKELPFGQVPMLQSGDRFVPQTNSILRVLARSGKRASSLYPADDVFACGIIDAVLDQDADFFAGLLVHNYKERFGFDFLNQPDQQSNLADVRKRLRERVLPAHLESLEKLVGRHGWLGGDWINPTIADFNWAPRLDYVNTTALPDGESQNILLPYPKLCAFIVKFKSLPEVLEYYSDSSL
jgi:glutathione S-transferase